MSPPGGALQRGAVVGSGDGVLGLRFTPPNEASSATPVPSARVNAAGFQSLTLRWRRERKGTLHYLVQARSIRGSSGGPK